MLYLSNKEIQEKIEIIYLKGQLDTNSEVIAQKKIDELMEKGVIKMLFNCEKMEYCTSSGLRVLLKTQMELQKIGGELRLCNLNGDVQDVFTISGFDEIIRVFDSESDALKDFQV